MATMKNILENKIDEVNEAYFNMILTPLMMTFF